MLFNGCLYIFLYRDAYAYSIRTKTWLNTKGKKILASPSSINM